MKKSIIVILFIFIRLPLNAQHDSCWNVLLLEKGNRLEIKPDMESFSKTGFYLYKNCIYEIDMKNQMHISGRLINIKRDTLFFTNYFNSNVANSANSILFTFPVYYKDLDKLNLVEDRALGLYSKHSLANFDFIFKKDTTNYYLKSNWLEIYRNDTSKYEIVPNLTGQGLGTLFEENGRTYFFMDVG